MNKCRGILFLLSSVVLSSVVLFSHGLAHHAFVEFDRGQVIEVEGEVIRVLWANPHIRFSVRSTDESGTETVWNVEGSSLSILSRMGITEDVITPGESIRVAGSPARSGAPRMTVSNVLVGGGEIVLGSRSTPRWEETAVGTDHDLMAGGTVSDDTTIFRVWTTDGDDPHSNTPGFWPGDYPLTDAARIAQSQWVPIAGSECEPKGMPTIMEQPYPIEFIQEGINVVLRIEEYDSVRTIHVGDAAIGGTATGEVRDKTLLGYSQGRWEDSTLVVETSDIDWMYFDKEGIPQGDTMSIVERFTPSEDGSRLEYTMTVTDPEVFTEPVSLERHWVWRPGEVVRPYECTWGE